MIVREDDYLIGIYESDRHGMVKELAKPYEIPTIDYLLGAEYRHMRVLNLVDVSHSQRFNPVQHKYISNLQDAMALSDRLLDQFWKGKDSMDGLFPLYKESAKDLLAACIWFFVNYKRMPYKDKNTMLWPEYYTDPQIGHRKLTGRVFDTEEARDKAEKGNRTDYAAGLVDPRSYYWIGKYSDLPHILSFLCHDYEQIFEVLKTDAEIFSLISPFIRAYDWKQEELLNRMFNPLYLMASHLSIKELFWVFHKDGDDFDFSERHLFDYMMLVGKAKHRRFFNVVSRLFCDDEPSEKEWDYQDDQEFRWANYQTLKRGLEIEPYKFESEDSKQRILYACYNQVHQDVEDMIKEIYLPRYNYGKSV